VPCDDRLGELELGGKAGEHFERGAAERRQRARGATELRGQALVADGAQARRALVEGHEPAGRLQPEGDRHRLLEQRAAGHDRRAVLAGKARGGVGRAVEVAEDRVQRAAGDEHRRRIDDVLAGGAVVDVGGRVAADLGAQRLDERCGRIADRGRRLAQRVDVVALGPARRGDRLGVRDRDRADRGLHTRERGLDVEECLQPGPVGDRRAGAPAGEDPVEEPHQPPASTSASTRCATAKALLAAGTPA
jgi:hypothetical protein